MGGEISITIEGPAKSGKSCIGDELYHFLLGLGLQVQYKDTDGQHLELTPESRLMGLKQVRPKVTIIEKRSPEVD
jgi:hypothetical protein